MSDSNFSQILKALSVPFHSWHIEWKPQVISADRKRALAAAYVDLREYQERLDSVCPSWSSAVTFLLAEDKVAAVVSITIAGSTRVNVGEAPISDENAFTAAYAQGFKRACSDFGLGRYLYRLPQVWCEYDEQRRAIVAAPEIPSWAKHPDERERGSTHAPAPAAAEEAPAPAVPDDPGQVKIHFGKNKGKTLAEVWAEGKEGQGWLRWCAEAFEPRDQASVYLQRMAKAFLLSQVAYAG